MKKVEITFNIDPNYFGSINNYDTEAYAFNLNKNIQKVFMVDSDYDLIYSGNTYRVSSPSDPRLELEISEYIENNWYTNKNKK
jgi:uncharacterized protein (DUF1015 family)